jgi:hypothetical protein
MTSVPAGGFRVAVWLGAALAIVGGCAGARPAQAPPVRPLSEPPAEILDAPRRPGRALILIVMPDAPRFRIVRRALIAEIKKDFDVRTRIIGAGAVDLSPVIAAGKPDCVVLMDDAAVEFYRRYQSAHHGEAPSALAILSSHYDNIANDLPHTSGILNQLSGVLGLVNLRSVVGRKVARVGVIHRPSFRRFIARQREIAAEEQIDIVAAEVPAAVTPKAIEAALSRLRRAGIDTLWVLNDHALLQDDLLAQAWRPELAKLAVPVVLGDATLVKPEANFGTLAMVADLEPLGVQTANLLFEVADSDWNPQEHPPEPPVSTISVLNARQARQQFGFRPENAGQIDMVLE